MTTLRTAEEVRDMAQMPDMPLPKPDPQMLAIAEKIVDQQAGEFDPDEFVDRYEDALRELIEEKKRGHVSRPTAPANDDTNVVDLMAALRKSLKVSGKEGAAAPVERRRQAPSRRGGPTEKPRPRRRGGTDDMSVQLQLPGDWPRNATWPDPLDQLRQLEHDKLDAKHEIRQVLDRYREKYCISARQVNQAVWGYVDDLLDDLFFEKEEALKAEIEEDIERENQGPLLGE